jgi:hypothetical protein
MKPLLCLFLASAMAIIPVAVASARGGGGGHGGGGGGGTDVIDFSFADDTGTVSGSFTGTLDLTDSLFLIDSGVVTSAPADFNLSQPIDLEVDSGGGGGGGGGGDSLDLDANGAPIFDSNAAFDLEATDAAGNGYELFADSSGGQPDSSTTSFTEYPLSGPTITLTADAADLTVAPEPSTWAMLAGGVMACIAFSRGVRCFSVSRR